jgi:hypothetical protein
MRDRALGFNRRLIFSFGGNRSRRCGTCIFHMYVPLNDS